MSMDDLLECPNETHCHTCKELEEAFQRGRESIRAEVIGEVDAELRSILNGTVAQLGSALLRLSKGGA